MTAIRIILTGPEEAYKNGRRHPARPGSALVA
jgi:hypothetical protein